MLLLFGFSGGDDFWFWSRYVLSLGCIFWMRVVEGRFVCVFVWVGICILLLRCSFLVWVNRIFFFVVYDNEFLFWLVVWDLYLRFWLFCFIWFCCILISDERNLGNVIFFLWDLNIERWCWWVIIWRGKLWMVDMYFLCERRIVIE